LQISKPSSHVKNGIPRVYCGRICGTGGPARQRRGNGPEVQDRSDHTASPKTPAMSQFKTYALAAMARCCPANVIFLVACSGLSYARGFPGGPQFPCTHGNSSA